MSPVKRVFTQEELMNVKYGSLTYFVAMELLNKGAPIKFNRLDLDLKPEDIEVYGYLKDRIKMDGSHEFIFEPKGGKK